MILLPAIDLVAGRCVRLEQGDFARETAYSDDPVAAVRAFADAGAKEIHLVDLDGAKAGAPQQHGLFADLAAAAGKARLQVAGGFRTLEQVEAALGAGASRVVIGSLALTAPDAFADILAAIGPDRITLALDVAIVDGEAMVATHGWQVTSGQSLGATLARFPSVKHLLVTDIAKDGMLTGPNVGLVRTIVRSHPEVALQASGGVAKIADLALLAEAGAARAIVGKAIWEGRFSVSEALDAVR